MRKGEKDLVSAAADAELGAAAVHCAGDVRSPVHAALQHRAADDEVTNNNSAIKPTCHFERQHWHIFKCSASQSYYSLVLLPGGCKVCVLRHLTRRWCGSQTSESRHLSRGRKKLARGESRGEETLGQRPDCLGRVSYPGLTADCRHGLTGDAGIMVMMIQCRQFRIIHVSRQILE